ncbi:MAG: SPOR domain-containing protein [Balneolales bacterium]
MKLSYKDLITLLATELKIDEKLASENLAAWVEAVKKGAKENGEYHVAGLGTFSLVKGEWSFSPENELALEVNYKYAGMKPIEILPAYASKIGKAEDEKDKSHDDKTESGEVKTEQEVKSPEEESKKEKPPETSISHKEKLEDEDPFFGLDSADSDFHDPFDVLDEFDSGEKKSILKQEETDDSKMEARLDKDKKDAVNQDSGTGKNSKTGINVDEKTDKKADKEVTKTGKKADDVPRKATAPEKETSTGFTDAVRVSGSDSGGVKKNTKVSDKRRRADKSNSKIWMLPIFVAAIILAAMLYFHFEGWFLAQKNRIEQMITEQQTDSPEVPLVSDEIAEPDASEDGIDALEDGIDASPFGLMGMEEGDLLYGSYTIVLHSIVSENRAQIEKNRLQEEGFKATMWQATLPNGRQTWRVGVGQFENVSDAEEAISNLPEPYKSNNFIIRIR